jgi:hypothetical protein
MCYYNIFPFYPLKALFIIIVQFRKLLRKFPVICFVIIPVGCICLYECIPDPPWERWRRRIWGI